MIKYLDNSTLPELCAIEYLDTMWYINNSKLTSIKTLWTKNAQESMPKNGYFMWSIGVKYILHHKRSTKSSHQGWLLKTF